MRVVLISKACIVGAYQTKLEAIAAYPDVELTAVVPPSWRDGQSVQRLEREHTDGYQLVATPMAWNGRYHLHFYPHLGRLLRHLRPDICHIDEEPYNLASALAVRAAHQIGARSLFFTWQNLLRRYPWPFAALEQSVYRRSWAAMVGNQEAAEVLRAKGYAGPVRLIPQFGVDAAHFGPPPERPERPFTIGYAGRLVEEKGLWTLVEALGQVGGDWRLLCLGSGPLASPLQERLRAEGWAERSRLVARVSASEMPTWYGRMDALVLPSRTRPNWKEQFGRVLIEAMACETPVVGSSSGEIPNVIGEAGLVFAEGDASALARHLTALRADAALRARLGRLGRERVLARYTQSQIAAETVALYRECMSAMPPAGGDRTGRGEP